MDVIVADAITRTYGRGRDAFTAVDGVALAVAQGELVALLGTNGAGKTSLVEVLEGLAAPTSGRVRVLGADPIADRAAIRPHTGMMLQEAGFARDLTVRETLRMWAGTLSAPRPIDEALGLVELHDRAGVRVKSLSGGEQRRLDLAMATLGRPKVLFLDEPTTGLDPASRRRTWGLMRAMLDEGATVLLTTHYLEEAEELADRVLIMSRGRVLRQGTVAEIVASQPASVSFATAGVISTGGAPGGLSPADLALLPALVTKPEVVRERVRLSSSDLQTTLTELLGLAALRGIALDDLEARSASLEQAFLALTGSAHENEDQAAATGSSAPPSTRAA